MCIIEKLYCRSVEQVESAGQQSQIGAREKGKMVSMKTVTTVHPAFRYETIVTRKAEITFLYSGN